VLIRVHAASLNFRDVLLAKSNYPGPHKEHVVPLSDGAGEVAAVGSAVHRVKIGDRVTANCYPQWIAGNLLSEYRPNATGFTLDGMLAQYAVVDENAIVHLPDYLSFVEAASLPCAAVSAWSALTFGKPLAPGQTVLVQGTGGVALFGLQIARMFGVRVLAITSSEAKAERLKALGASAVVNYREVPQWSKAILELTGGVGVDKVVEIGGETTLHQSAACSRLGGEIGVVGYVSGFGGGVGSLDIMVRSLTIKGISMGPRVTFDALLAAMAVSEVHPVIDSTFALSDFKDAYHRIDSGAHVGKVVIDLNN
jgi:NADPH:quinone reductase-like Zn-dependent oxidoreductase